MKKTSKALFLIFLLSIIITNQSVWAVIGISVTPKVPGGWFETISYWDLQAGAGSDLKSEYESDIDTESIDIAETAGSGDNWRVDVKKIDTNWDNDLMISIERMSDGTGPGSISGGVAYMQLTNTDQIFFSGSGDRSGIQVRIKISGVSVINIFAGNYDTTLYYTVVDID